MSEITDQLIAVVRKLRDECDRVTAVSRLLVAESREILKQTQSLREHWASCHRRVAEKP